MIEVMVRDSTTGMGKTGLAYGSVVFSYWREGAATGVTATCVDAALGTWTTKGWKEVDATNQKGVYQFGLPNLALATGVGAVTINFQASGMIDKSVRILLGISWNAAWDAEVQSEANDALVAVNLDHLLAVACDESDITLNVTAQSVIAFALATGGTISGFNATTDPLQSIRDKLPTNLEDLSVTDTTGLVATAATQHVIVDSGTVTTLTNLPAATTDWLTAAAVKADAVTKIQAGLTQADAQVLYRTKGVVYFVSTTGNDSNSGLTPALAKLTPKTVIEAMSAQDVCVIGPGTFAMGAAKITQPASTKVIGSGVNVTKLTSTIATNTAYSHGNNCHLADFELYCSGTQCYGLGSHPTYGDSAFTNILVERVKVTASYDAFYCGVANSSGTFIDCEFFGNGYDGWTVDAGGCTFELIRCRMYTASTVNFSRAAPISGASTIRFVDCELHGDSGTATTAGGLQVGGTSTVVAQNCRMSSRGTTAYDVLVADGGICILTDCGFDRTKTSGTITEHATDNQVTPTTASKTGYALSATGADLAAQAIRDAMKLAPTAGDPAAGSIDKHVDDADTNAAKVAGIVELIP